MSIKERRKELLAARETLLENMAIEYGDFRVYCSWFKDGEYSKEGCAKKLNDYISTTNGNTQTLSEEEQKKASNNRLAFKMFDICSIFCYNFVCILKRGKLYI